MKLLWSASILLFVAIPSQAQDFEYAAKHHHALRDCRGMLTIDSDGIAYKASDPDDTRKWGFGDIRVLKIKSPSEISIETYEDQKRWAGKDRVFEFTLTGKKASPELSAFLLRHVKRPMEIAVIPESAERPVYEMPVKHLRMVSGTRGVLRVYTDKVVYQTAVEGDSRYWRISDIERFSQPDRFRIEIDSYLPEAYNFELMDDLPEGLHDYLWVRLHPSSYGNQ